MSASIPQAPKYRHYKPKDLAVVRIDGKDYYLGKFGSTESKERYGRLIAEWFTTGRVEPESPAPVAAPAAGPMVSEVIAAFWTHAERYYRTPEGAPSPELENFRIALRPLKRLYGRTSAADFGPLKLRAVREAMIRSGLCRTTINARVNKIRLVFRWAVSAEIIPATNIHALREVEPLKKGRTDAPEPEDVLPVPMERVETVLPLLPRPVAAMVRLQLLTGCRAGEVMAMRSRDIIVDAAGWEFRPAWHKNAWRGQARAIPLGPQAQTIIREFLKPDPDAYLFDPREALAVRQGKTPPSSKAKRSKRKPVKKPADRYDRRSYRQAIVRACDRAFPHPTLARVRAKDLTPEQRAELKRWRDEHRWVPLQLRHTAATALRARFGLEATANVLGHAKPDTTLIYAERNLDQARAIMAEVG